MTLAEEDCKLLGLSLRLYGYESFDWIETFLESSAVTLSRYGINSMGIRKSDGSFIPMTNPISESVIRECVWYDISDLLEKFSQLKRVSQL